MFGKNGTMTIMEMMLWLGRMLILIAAVFGVSFITRYVVVYSPEVDDLESELLMMRVINSKNCFAYHDGLRTYQGILDLSKFSDDILKNCLQSDNYFLEVSVMGNKFYNTKEEDFKKALRDRPFFRYYSGEERRYVLIKDKDMVKGDFITFKYVLKNA